MQSPLIHITGVIAASVTPFNKDYSIDYTALEDNVVFVARQRGLQGLLVNGLAAEVTSLDRKERVALIDSVRKRVPSDYIVISGVSSQSTREAVEMAQAAAAAGANALLVTAPGIFARGGAADPEAPIAFFKAVAGAVIQPVLVFQHQASSGLAYAASTLAAICSIPNVAGIKSTIWDQELYEREWTVLKSLSHPPLVFSGNDTLLLSNFCFGCDGAILGIANLIPNAIVELLEAARSGNLLQAREIYHRILPLIHTIYKAPAFRYYSRMKEAMVLLGQLTQAVVRPPLVPIAEEEKSAIRKALKQSGLL